MSDVRPVIGFIDERFFLTPEARRAFAEIGELRRISGPADAGECDVLCAFHTAPVDAALIEAAPRCRLIVHNGSAVLCDVDVATAHGVAVVHFPGFNARSVAEHTIGLLLDVWKGLTASDRAVRSGRRWHTADPDLMTVELFGKSLGLVGFGHVAQSVAEIASRGFGMRILVWSRHHDAVEAAGWRWTSNLDELLAESDAVSLHLALNDDTKNILDATRIAHLKRGTIVVNTARAALVDCDALHRALLSGAIGGAAFDVWPGNGPDPGFVLLRSPNTILTQHNAGFTAEAAARSMDAAKAAVVAVLRGEVPASGRVVNPSVLSIEQGRTS